MPSPSERALSDAGRSAWRWVDPKLLRLLHDESLAEHGGASGIRDAALLDAALARPVLLASHAAAASPDLAELAAAYASGLVGHRPFVDGNPHAAFLSVGLFLGLNGWRLKAGRAEATLALFALASGDWDESDFAAWLRVNIDHRAA